MVNFQDPTTIALDSLALVKLWHTVNGLYIWEFVTTLDYEWSVFRGRRQYLWTIWVYSLTRVATLMAVIVNMIGFDALHQISCQAWVTSEVFFAYLAVAGATLLIVLRTIAIWNRDKVVIMIAMGIWSGNIGFLIHSIVTLRSIWAPAQGVCVVLNTDSSKYNIIATLATDVILLLVMLAGLSRIRRQMGGSMSGLGLLLWKQGIIWILLAVAAEVPAAVLIFLNLNAPLNLLFQTPALITVSIAATRMYRSLTNFGSSEFLQSLSESPIMSKTKRGPLGPLPLNRPMEVAVHMNTEQSPTSQASQYTSHLSADGHLYDKPQGLGGGGDIESSGKT